MRGQNYNVMMLMLAGINIQRFSAIRRQGIFTTKLPTKDGTSNIPLSCPTKHRTPACV